MQSDEAGCTLCVLSMRDEHVEGPQAILQGRSRTQAEWTALIAKADNIFDKDDNQADYDVIIHTIATDVTWITRFAVEDY